MPATAEKKLPRPRQKTIDIYNSTSTGHQVGSGVSKPMPWHRSRTSKLQRQFRNNPLSFPIPGDAVSEAKGASGNAATHITSHCSTRKESHEHIMEVPATAGTIQASPRPPYQHSSKNGPILACVPNLDTSTHSAQAPTPTSVTKIFARCTIYINGTTSPAISDHVLKRHLCTHGASIAIMLTRKSVTHVILGKPSSAGGAGGGLAAGKLQKELTKNGRPIKFVSVQWALDSIKAGKRLPEANYAVMNMHSRSQRSLKNFAKTSPAGTANSDRKFVDTEE